MARGAAASADWNTALPALFMGTIGRSGSGVREGSAGCAFSVFDDGIRGEPGRFDHRHIVWRIRVEEAAHVRRSVRGGACRDSSTAARR